MSQRLFFQCAYDGTNYSGWQKQPNAITIQEEIERQLSKLFPTSAIEILGCGRTDAGVHALKTFFHTDLETVYTLDQIKYKLNNMLPKDISIDHIYPVNPEAHARFDATQRTYQYFIHQNKQPFIHKYSSFQPRPLSIEKMNQAAVNLLGRQDFTSFSKLHTDVNNNFCEIFAAEWKKMGDQWCFEITANRFLRGMVRTIVGTLLEVGLGKIEPVEISKIIQLKDRKVAGFSASAKGLFLKNVAYPYI